MNIQGLAVMAIIIILPMSLILGAYTQNQVTTLSMQIKYDQKLQTATYDAVKVFQMNTINSSTSDLANSKMRDIKASANSFFNSLGSNFNLSSYDTDTLKQYVPALVYTLYDGYYIYSPYTNTWDDETINQTKNYDGTKYKDDDEKEYTGIASYSNGEKLYGLKPYIYYSCRYIKGNLDVVITYSLDNYITIKGTNGGDVIEAKGYLLSNTSSSGKEYTFKSKDKSIKIDILAESLQENVYVDGGKDKYYYKKINGVKYYTKGEDNEVFTIVNGKKIVQPQYNSQDVMKNNLAQEYYKQAFELKDYMISNGIADLRTSDAVDEKGNKIYSPSGENKTPINSDYEIFDFDNSKGIENQESNFNRHRLEVIRYSIEKNLSIAIGNFNDYSGLTTEFRMPKLKEEEWDLILNNMSVISFMQGLSIGGKVYNGYSIVPNNKNEEVVTEDSIYIANGIGVDSTYYKITDSKLTDLTGCRGVFNVDFERKTSEDNNYYYPNEAQGSYTSIVTSSGISYDGDIYEYLKDKKDLAQIYFTALARERMGMYKVDNTYEEMQELMKN